MATPLSHRNLIINGDMRIAQRGTSFTQTNPGTTTFHYLDRWCMQSDLPQLTYTITKSNDAPDGFSNSFKLEVTSPASSTFPDASGRYFRTRYKIEAQDCRYLLNNNITLSFWVKSSITGKFDVTFFAEDTASGSNHNVNPYTINTANTWEKKEITIAAPATINNDIGMGLDVQFQLAKSGSGYQTSSTGVWGGTKLSSTDSTADLANTTNATFYLTGVQLEIGSVATPFEHRSFGEELARCQRYYQRWESSSSYKYLAFGSGVCNSGDGTVVATGGIDWIVPMRTTPSIGTGGFGAWSGSSHFSCTGFGNSYATEQGMRPDVITSGATTGQSYVFYGSSGAYFYAFAEI